MSAISCWRKRKWWWLSLLLLVVGLGIGLQRGVSFGSQCWSPNHEYYIVRKESLLSAVLARMGDEHGWLLIYDKHGNLLHRWDAELNVHGGGPYWLGKSVILPNDGIFHLPISGGDGGLRRICF